jgi:hypothetical protein
LINSKTAPLPILKKGMSMGHAGYHVSLNRLTMLRRVGFIRLEKKTDCSNHGNIMNNILKRTVAYPYLLMKAEDEQLQPLVGGEVLCELGRDIG